jgi:hypothetical protein
LLLNYNNTPRTVTTKYCSPLFSTTLNTPREMVDGLEFTQLRVRSTCDVQCAYLHFSFATRHAIAPNKNINKTKSSSACRVTPFGVWWIYAEYIIMHEHHIHVDKCELATICFNLHFFTFHRPSWPATIRLVPPLSHTLPAGDRVQAHHRRLDIWVTLFASASHTCAWRGFVCVLRRT